MTERNDSHYVTSPEREWRCAECQQMCHDDARCDCCLAAQASVASLTFTAGGPRRFDSDAIRLRHTVRTPQPWRTDIADLLGELERLRAVVARLTSEARDASDHIADFHEDNHTLLAIVREAYPDGPEAIIDAIRMRWL